MKTIVALGVEGIGPEVVGARRLTRDQGGTATTREFCQAVRAALRNG